MSSISIYAAGGAGINVVSGIGRFHNKEEEGFAKLLTYYIDTSRSNLNKQADSSNVFLLEGLDGSGKHRAGNYDVIAESAKSILHRHKTSDLNIVVHSGSGGSGSVIGPVLVSELLSRDEMVIVLFIGSTNSRIETENTLKTLKSYEAISKKYGKPIACCYRENSSTSPQAQVNGELHSMILLLAAMFSGNNSRLDSADLYNFLNYTKVTDYSPKLSLLDFYGRSFDLNEIGNNLAVMSMVTLSTDGVNHDTDFPVEYRADGILPDCVKDKFIQDLPLHVCMINGYFPVVADRLNVKLQTFRENRQVVNEKTILSSDDKPTDTGLVL